MEGAQLQADEAYAAAYACAGLRWAGQPRAGTVRRTPKVSPRPAGPASSP